jgi:hypothetical protein
MSTFRFQIPFSHPAYGFFKHRKNIVLVKDQSLCPPDRRKTFFPLFVSYGGLNSFISAAKVIKIQPYKCFRGKPVFYVGAAPLKRETFTKNAVKKLL